MRIAAYCRVSTDHTDQLNSLETQREFFELYAKQSNYELFRVYADEGITGTSMKRRVEFQKLMEDAKYGFFDMVVVKDVSRFARNTVDFLQSIRTLKGMGIGTIFVTNNMTTLGDSEFILTIFSAMAQEESANLSKRVKFGKDINSKKGRVPPRIFGYDRIDNFTLRINEKEAAIVRDIYDMYINQGFGSRLIALALERRGETTKYGCDWNTRAVRRILDDPIYSGHYINHKYQVVDFLEGTRGKIPEEQNYHHERPEWAIVSPETFARAQEVRKERIAQYGGEDAYIHRSGRHSARHLFSTLIKCECCGRSFYRYTKPRKNGSLYVVWKCTTNNQYTGTRCPNSTTVREEKLIEYLSNYLSSLVKDKRGLAQRLLEAAAEQEQKAENTLNKESLKKKKDRLEKRIEKHMDMYADEIIDIETLKTKVAAFRAEIAEIEEQLYALEVDDRKQRDTQQEIDQYIEEIEDFLSLKTANNTDLRKIISSISVNEKREVTIHLHDFT